MKIGDIVAPNVGHGLRSGASAYGAAVVVSMEPFVMVSEHADMRWGAQEAKNFHVRQQATPEQLAICMQRLLK